MTLLNEGKRLTWELCSEETEFFAASWISDNPRAPSAS